uniref:Uncharacterized protein n=1 Tax=Lepeophtheirus salmonis TaxID=72036 RepID=A0A0K2TYF1_LEPSM
MSCSELFPEKSKDILIYHENEFQGLQEPENQEEFDYLEDSDSTRMEDTKKSNNSDDTQEWSPSPPERDSTDLIPPIPHKPPPSFLMTALPPSRKIGRSIVPRMKRIFEKGRSCEPELEYPSSKSRTAFDGNSNKPGFVNKCVNKVKHLMTNSTSGSTTSSH